MIVVVEGISAAGKTTWCQEHWPTFVPEAPPTAHAPPAVGALLMSLSTVVVALNAQLLRQLDLSPE